MNKIDGNDSKLKKLSDRVWYYPFEEKRDRPNLGYIKGDNFSVCVDAGHSEEHLKEFYNALKKEELPLPSLTVLTHWHWDHTFAMHAVNGLCIANSKTNEHLKEFKNKLLENGSEFFLNMHESIRSEYKDGKEVIVVPSDIVFDKELLLDAGNCLIHLLETKSPHTDDSTLVHVINEGIVFLGDSNSGEFPTWKVDKKLAKEYKKTLSNIDANIFLEGHWSPDTKEAIVNDIEI